MKGVKRILRSSAIIRKTIELVIATVCLSLVLDAYVNGAVPQWKNVKITYVTCCWCIIISTMAILCLMAGQMLPDLAMTALSAVGGILFILSGQETLSCWIDEKDYKLSDKQIVSNSLPSLGWIIGMNQVRAAGILCLLLVPPDTLERARKDDVWQQTNEDAVPLIKPLRFLELILCSICMTLFVVFIKMNNDHFAKIELEGLIFTTLFTYTIICLIDMICQIVGEPIPRIPILCICVSATAMYIATSTVCLLGRYKQRGLLLSMGIAGIIAAVIFFLDAILVCWFPHMKYNKYRIYKASNIQEIYTSQEISKKDAYTMTLGAEHDDLVIFEDGDKTRRAGRVAENLLETTPEKTAVMIDKTGEEKHITKMDDISKKILEITNHIQVKTLSEDPDMIVNIADVRIVGFQVSDIPCNCIHASDNVLNKSPNQMKVEGENFKEYSSSEEKGEINCIHYESTDEPRKIKVRTVIPEIKYIIYDEEKIVMKNTNIKGTSDERKIIMTVTKGKTSVVINDGIDHKVALMPCKTCQNVSEQNIRIPKDFEDDIKEKTHKITEPETNDYECAELQVKILKKIKISISGDEPSLAENIHLETEEAEYPTIKQCQKFKELQYATQAKTWKVAHSDHKIKSMCTCSPTKAQKAVTEHEDWKFPKSSESIRKQGQTNQESKATMQTLSWDTKHSENKTRTMGTYTKYPPQTTHTPTIKHQPWESQKTLYTTKKQTMANQEKSAMLQVEPWKIKQSEHIIKRASTCSKCSPPVICTTATREELWESPRLMSTMQKKAMTGENSLSTFHVQSWDLKHSKYLKKNVWSCTKCSPPEVHKITTETQPWKRRKILCTPKREAKSIQESLSTLQVEPWDKISVLCICEECKRVHAVKDALESQSEYKSNSENETGRDTQPDTCSCSYIQPWEKETLSYILQKQGKNRENLHVHSWDYSSSEKEIKAKCICLKSHPQLIQICQCQEAISKESSRKQSQNESSSNKTSELEVTSTETSRRQSNNELSSNETSEYELEHYPLTKQAQAYQTMTPKMQVQGMEAKRTRYMTDACRKDELYDQTIEVQRKEPAEQTCGEVSNENTLELQRTQSEQKTQAKKTILPLRKKAEMCTEKVALNYVHPWQIKRLEYQTEIIEDKYKLTKPILNKKEDHCKCIWTIPEDETLTDKQKGWTAHLLSKSNNEELKDEYISIETTDKTELSQIHEPQAMTGTKQTEETYIQQQEMESSDYESHAITDIETIDETQTAEQIEADEYRTEIEDKYKLTKSIFNKEEDCCKCIWSITGDETLTDKQKGWISHLLNKINSGELKDKHNSIETSDKTELTQMHEAQAMTDSEETAETYIQQQGMESSDYESHSITDIETLIDETQTAKQMEATKQSLDTSSKHIKQANQGLNLTEQIHESKEMTQTKQATRYEEKIATTYVQPWYIKISEHECEIFNDIDTDETHENKQQLEPEVSACIEPHKYERSKKLFPAMKRRKKLRYPVANPALTQESKMKDEEECRKKTNTKIPQNEITSTDEEDSTSEGTYVDETTDVMESLSNLQTQAASPKERTISNIRVTNKDKQKIKDRCNERSVLESSTNTEKTNENNGTKIESLSTVKHDKGIKQITKKPSIQKCDKNVERDFRKQFTQQNNKEKKKQGKLYTKMEVDKLSSHSASPKQSKMCPKDKKPKIETGSFNTASPSKYAHMLAWHKTWESRNKVQPIEEQTYPLFSKREISSEQYTSPRAVPLFSCNMEESTKYVSTTQAAYLPHSPCSVPTSPRVTRPTITSREFMSNTQTGHHLPSLPLANFITAHDQEEPEKCVSIEQSSSPPTTNYIMLSNHHSNSTDESREFVSTTQPLLSAPLTSTVARSSTSIQEKSKEYVSTLQSSYSPLQNSSVQSIPLSLRHPPILIDMKESIKLTTTTQSVYFPSSTSMPLTSRTTRPITHTQVQPTEYVSIIQSTRPPYSSILSTSLPSRRERSNHLSPIREEHAFISTAESTLFPRTPQFYSQTHREYTCSRQCLHQQKIIDVSDSDNSRTHMVQESSFTQCNKCGHQHSPTHISYKCTYQATPRCSQTYQRVPCQCSSLESNTQEQQRTVMPLYAPGEYKSEHDYRHNHHVNIPVHDEGTILPGSVLPSSRVAQRIHSAVINTDINQVAFNEQSTVRLDSFFDFSSEETDNFDVEDYGHSAR